MPGASEGGVLPDVRANLFARDSGASVRAEVAPASDGRKVAKEGSKEGSTDGAKEGSMVSEDASIAKEIRHYMNKHSTAKRTYGERCASIHTSVHPPTPFTPPSHLCSLTPLFAPPCTPPFTPHSQLHSHTRPPPFTGELLDHLGKKFAMETRGKKQPKIYELAIAELKKREKKATT